MQSSKKRQRKKKSLQRYRALSDNSTENKMFISKNDRQDRSLTGQVHDQAGHCPLTGRYLQPWTVAGHDDWPKKFSLGRALFLTGKNIGKRLSWC